MPIYQKRCLTVQDISCFGKCSNTVAVPVVSAAGAEAVMLPTALLSTHTGGFKGFTFLDLTDEMRKITDHWIASEIRFECLYTGYFGSAEQLSLVREREEKLLTADALRIIDPVMGDGGKMYPIYDDAYAAAMRAFCAGADVITPNITEACLLAGIPYIGEHYTPENADKLLTALGGIGVKRAVVTGFRFGTEGAEENIGIAARDYTTGDSFTASGVRENISLHGTGDVFAAALVGNLLKGEKLRPAVMKTLAFLAECIKDTAAAMPEHWYGVLFEKQLWRLA